MGMRVKAPIMCIYVIYIISHLISEIMSFNHSEAVYFATPDREDQAN